jgi:hypothetical protein
MKLSSKTIPIDALLACCLLLTAPMPAPAQEADSPIAACLKLWRDHPFGTNPQFKTLGRSLKVFGVGSSVSDTEPTSSPSLVLIEPIFNVMGGSTVELLNPNGWYCMRTAVSLMGMVTIRAHCKARLAATSDGKTVQGDNAENRSLRDLTVTMIGGVSVERPCN